VDLLSAERTLVAGLAATVAALGDAPAYSDKVGVLATNSTGDWRTWSWTELSADVLDIAAALIELGVEQGDRVAIMASNRTEHVIADLAAVHAGAVPMSIYSTYSAAQVEFVTRHAEPTVVILEGADEWAAWAPTLRHPTSIRRIVVLDPTSVSSPGAPDHGESRPGAVAPRVLTWANLLASGKEFRGANGAACQARIDGVSPEDPVTILYTSGSTGDPKGVVISHANMWFASVGRGKPEISAGVDTVCYLPYAHISERLLGMYIPQTSGGHVHQIGRARDVLAALVDVRPMMFFGVPRIWEKLADVISAHIARQSPARQEEIEAAMADALAWVEARQFGCEMRPDIQARYDAADGVILRELRACVGLDRLQWAGVGGAPMPLSLTRLLAGLGIVVYDIYGMTETTASISASGPEGFRLGSVGRPPTGNRVLVGDDGELLVKGPAVSAGYFRQPDATGELFDADGWLRTGDIGWVDDDGFVYVTDRKKELIVTSLGKNIAPSNVEALVKRHPAISEALAYGDGRPYLVALVTLTPGIADPSTADELVGEAIAAANARLSRPEQIKRFAILPDQWTVENGAFTATLKLRRRHLYQTYQTQIAGLYAD
jgi:long-chain acyl-CoA synthetase